MTSDGVPEELDRLTDEIIREHEIECSGLMRFPAIIRAIMSGTIEDNERTRRWAQLVGAHIERMRT